MARLSKREAEMLKQLQSKADAPDPAPVSKSATFSVDLGDKEQVAMAMKLGLLDGYQEEEEEQEEESTDEEGDETPRRRGYFGDS